MGYSVSVRISDAQLRQRMLEFLQREFRSITGLLGHQSHVKRGPIAGPLAYDRSRKCVGFDYSHLSIPEDNYVFGLMSWLALTCGDKGKDGRPFIVYDGEDRWPVVVGKRTPQTPDDWHCVESDGWRRQEVTALFKMLLSVDKRQEKILRAELARLATAWATCPKEIANA
jgi:hypothetical protein